MLKDGAFGDATTFEYKASHGKESYTAQHKYMADGKDSTVANDWQSETGAFHPCSGTNCGTTGWVQVTLPKAAICQDAAVIGYAGGSHMPATSVSIMASKDENNWVSMASWTKHPGSTAADISGGSCGSGGCSYLVSGSSSSYVYSKVISKMDSTYAATFDKTKAAEAYKYWRIQGGAYTNGWSIISNWILRCWA